MDCREISELLSAYHDGEVSANIHASISAHIADCPGCLEELEAFRAMSQLAARLEKPVAPDRWEEIKSELAVAQSSVRKGRWLSSWRILAAAVLVAIGLGLRSWPSVGHHHAADDFDLLLRTLGDNPESAKEILVTKYGGRRVSIPDVATELGYQPIVAHGLPDDYALTGSYLLKMPCCTCLEAVYRKADGKTLCIFEHEGEQAGWFGHRPAIHAMCHGMDCRLVQADGFLAASWKSGQRYVTVVGATDVEEVERLVEKLEAHRRSL